MKEIIFLEPYFVEKIWGGNKLKTEFNYNIPSDKTGECWAISAHKNGQSIVNNGKYKGKKLSEIYNVETNIFGTNIKNEFPLLIKILDAKDDLSVQVHPGDKYAKDNDNDLGKTECWLVLDANKDTDMIMGHNAKNLGEVKDMIENSKWDKFLNIINIRKGDFFFVKTGTVHAIRKNSLIYELQQSSDTTYRLYDYNRLDNGKLRDLHINKAIDVIYAPQKRFNTEVKVMDENITNLTINNFFSLIKLENKATRTYNISNEYLLASVIDGNGMLDGVPIKKGDHFIIPYQYGDFTINGNVTLLIASE